MATHFGTGEIRDKQGIAIHGIRWMAQSSEIVLPEAVDSARVQFFGHTANYWLGPDRDGRAKFEIREDDFAEVLDACHQARPRRWSTGCFGLSMNRSAKAS
jgi:hypothetical protein